MATCGDDDAGEAWPEREGRVAGVLGALRAVSLLGTDEAEAWRLRLIGLLRAVSLFGADEAEARWLPLIGLGGERPTPSDGTRRAADELLQELLEAVPVDDGGRGDAVRRFEGAMVALRAVGASSGGWYERLARRMGWPTARETGHQNRGGTQRDLLAVLPGPAGAVDGVRVLCALRFDDGVTLLLRLEKGVDAFEDDRWDFELFDDVGTTYSRAGGGGGAQDLGLLYSTPVPADARCLELRRAGSRPIRIAL